MKHCEIKIEALPKEKWKGVPIPLVTRSDSYYDLEIFATPQTTFEELYYHMNHLIREKGFINLDFLGNLGHSIVKHKEDRIYIEKENPTRLEDVGYFTFEPHIGTKNSKYGYKKENIYYFENGRLTEL